ncbi:MAG: ABC transporter ATP-binding protein [Victivallales bacterium]|nr:ABC transporter ATP-binding protein [Victivallales bacterium]
MLILDKVSARAGDFILKNVSFTVKEGEYFVLLGESGSGKTVLLEMLAGLTPPVDGVVSLCGEDITKSPSGGHSLGLVYQDQALFPHMSVGENIAFALKCRHLGKKEIKARVEKIAEELGVHHLVERDPDTLSIGEAQRAAIARTLAAEPLVLLLDEPLASLDRQAKRSMRALLRKINNSGTTVIHVTHDYEEALALAGRIAILENGTVSQVGDIKEVFRQPESRFVADFIGIKNFFPGEFVKTSQNSGVFKTNGVEFDVATSAESGKRNIIISSELMTISETNSEPQAENRFRGVVKDIENASAGIEVLVDIDIEVVVSIDAGTIENLRFETDDEVTVEIKTEAIEVL